MEAKVTLNLSKDELFELRSIAQCFNTLTCRRVKMVKTTERYYSFDSVILSKSEIRLLEKLSSLHPF